MKVFSFLMLLHTSPLLACELKHETVSLSAPVTSVLEFMGLLESPKLHAISLFHPVGHTKKEKLSGGLFLSQKTIDRFKHHLVYFDESRELKERLKLVAQKVEIPTRSLTPFSVTRQTLSKLKANLSHCEQKLAQLEDWLKKEEEWQQAQSPLPKTYFFLGAIHPTRWPEYVIVRDGFVLSLLENKKLETFSSELSYVRWGEKWKKTVKDERLIGLVEDPHARIEKLGENTFNFYYPGALTPGIYQIRFLRFLRERWP